MGFGKFWKVMQIYKAFSRTWIVLEEGAFHTGFGKVLNFCLGKF